MKLQMIEKILRTIVLMAALLLGFDAASAQTIIPDRAANQTRQVVGGVSGNSTRFTSLGALIQMRLQVISPAGETVFDSGFKQTNTIDWTPIGSQGRPPADATYVCVITVKDSSGLITSKQGLLTLRDQSVSLKQADSSLVTSAQAQAAGPTSGEDLTLTLLEPGESAATAVLAHDGSRARLAIGSGGLSISSGDFFANKLLEHIRLTAEGNVGIGVAEPQAKLEVAGQIKASQGIIFPDGTVQYSASSKTLGAKSSRSTQKPGQPGSGEDFETQSITQNHIVKFNDNAGTLGDSIILETSGRIGIGTNTPDSLVNVQGAIPSLLGHLGVIRATGSFNGFGLLMDATGTGNNSLGLAVNGAPKAAFSWDNARNFFGIANFNYSANDFALRVNADGSFTYNDGASSAERFRVTAAGRVGIGTNSPGFKLEVNDTGNAGLRVVTGTSGGSVASFASSGNFDIDAPFIPGGRLRVQQDGNVGIGIDTTLFPAFPNPFRLQALTPGNLGLRVEALTAGGAVASFGGNGDFQIDKSGVGGASGRFIVKENGNTGIGATNPAQKLHVSGTGIIRALVNSDSNAGLALGLNNQPKWSVATTTPGTFQIFNDAIGQNALLIDTSTNNVGIGTSPTAAKMFVNTSGQFGLIVSAGTTGGNVAEFGDKGEFVINGSGIVGARVRVQENSAVLINNPSGMLTETAEKLVVNGVIKTNFGTGLGTPLCANGSQEIAICGSSSIRYKENVNNFTPGLNMIGRLRPVSFNWKQDGTLDFGLIAEEVAKVEPLLAIRDPKGEIVGVKYDRIAVVMLNAVKEQQVQIASQQDQIKQQTAQIKQQAAQIQRQAGELQNQGQLFKQQQSQLAGLKRLVCKGHPGASACK